MLNKNLLNAEIKKQTGKTLKQLKGITIYNGASMLNSDPIMSVLTFETSNRKTGQMAQLWILRSDMSPVEASKAKADTANCGNCPLKQSEGGACYVNLGQAPNAVYNGFIRGIYPVLDIAQIAINLKVKKVDILKSLFESLYIRLGAYGDPAALPFDLVNTLVKYAKGYTGYTHQINRENIDKRFNKITMISADTVKQAIKYQSLGYRTFRVKTPDSPLLENEIECLADSKGLTCAECRLCDGNNRTGFKPNIAITVHGTRAKKHSVKYATANLIAKA